MKGKNFYKKVFPWLGASFYFYPNKTLDFLNLIETPEEILINAKVDDVESINSSKNTLNLSENLALQNYIKDLNQTEVYLLVTNPIPKKLDHNILLLLQSENRLNSVPALVNRRSQNILFKRFNQKSANLIGRFQGRIRLRKNLRLPRILMVEKNLPAARFLTTSNSYNVNNLGGYKSICPVFFDKNTAEDFLIKTTKDTLSISNYSLGSDQGSKDIINGILNSKIISVGLGDFIHYYSSSSNEKFLEKIEFLFFPPLEDLQVNQKKSNNSVSTKSFSFYQNKYYKLKS
jgi:hypothetical protein